MNEAKMRLRDVRSLRALAVWAALIAFVLACVWARRALLEPQPGPLVIIRAAQDDQPPTGHR